MNYLIIFISNVNVLQKNFWGGHTARLQISSSWALGHKLGVLATALPGFPRFAFFTSLNYLSNFLHNSKQFQVIVGKIRDGKFQALPLLSPPARDPEGGLDPQTWEPGIVGAGWLHAARRPSPRETSPSEPRLFLSNSDLISQLGGGFLYAKLVFSLGGKHNLSAWLAVKHTN